jgi:antitoxin MazE
MQLAIAKWGNSLALRLPRHVIEEARLEEGSPVDLTVLNGSVVVTPVRKKFKLDALLAQMEDCHKTDETDWGEAQGEEDW